MKNTIVSLLTLLSLVNVSSAFAGQADLNHWFESELESHQYVLAQAESDHAGVEYLLKTIRVRLRATLSVELPLVAKGKVRPEIELYYTR